MKRPGLFILFLIAINCNIKAQFTSVRVKVDGLTCSACSFATQKSLRELDFIDSVKMDLSTNLAILTFKPSKKVDIGLISKKVYDAGFSVGQLTAVYSFNSLPVGTNTCFEYMGDTYNFTETKDTTLNGTSTLLFIGKKFMNKAELKKWKGVKSVNYCKVNDSFSGKVYTVAIQ